MAAAEEVAVVTKEEAMVVAAEAMVAAEVINMYTNDGLICFFVF